jgi:type I restriction enzyme S subunit
VTWPTTTLGAVATIERRGVEPADIPAGTRYLGLENIEPGGVITEWQTVGETAIASTKFRFDAGHVLFGKLRPNLGKVALPHFGGVCSTDILPIRPGPHLDRGYLRHFLAQPSMVAYAASRATGANLPRLSPVVLASFELPFPPLEEQRRVASIIDQAAMLCTNRRQSMAYLGELTGSVFLDMFGDPTTNTMGWNAGQLGDVCVRVTDGEHQTPKRSHSGIPLLSARNVQAGWIDFSVTDFIDNEEYDALRKRIQPVAGDVLISCSGTIGRVAMVRERTRFAMVRSVALVRPGGDVLPEFLEQLLSTRHMRALMTSRANSSAQANLFQNQIRALPVIVPPLAQQRRFATQAQEVRRMAAQSGRSLDGLAELFAALQALAFKGQLLQAPRS